MTNFENLKNHAWQKTRNAIIGVTASVTVLSGVSGCTPGQEVSIEITADSSSISEAESNVSYEGSDTSSTVSREESEVSSETSREVSSDESREESSEASREESDPSSEVSGDTSQPEYKEPTADGVEVYEYLKKASCAIYGQMWGQSLEEVQEERKNYRLESINILTDYYEGYDPSVNAVVLQKPNMDGDYINCYAIELCWKHDMYSPETEFLYVPTDSEHFANFCDLMNIPANDLSKLKYTADELKALDSESSSAMREIIITTMFLEGLYDLAVEGEMQR